MKSTNLPYLETTPVDSETSVFNMELYLLIPPRCSKEVTDIKHINVLPQHETQGATRKTASYESHGWKEPWLDKH